jgi:hypothetical protein
MSLVEFGKSVHRRLTEACCGARIVFHHVPKCGGTSVGRSLRRAYILSQGTVTPEESFRAFAACAGSERKDELLAGVLQFREVMLLYMMYSDVRCVSAHIPFSNVAHDRFHGKYLFVTLLRDPVERFISHFFWSYGKAHAHGGIDEELADFLGSERARALGSTFVRYFSGRPPGYGSTLTQGVDQAIRNLRLMDHVGFLDDVARFGTTLRELTGKRMRIGRENVGAHKSKYAGILDGALRRAILDVCAPDREIWDAIQDLRLAAPSGQDRGLEAAPTGPVWPARADGRLVYGSE